MIDSVDSLEVSNKARDKLRYFVLSELLFLYKSIEFSSKRGDYWPYTNVYVFVDGPSDGGEVEWEIRNDGDYLLIEELLELNSFPLATVDDVVKFIIEWLVKFIFFADLLCMD